MYLVFPISYFLTLALAVPAGALLVRIFIVQHDCGHGSFFASASANSDGRPGVQPLHHDAVRPIGPASTACITRAGAISIDARAVTSTRSCLTVREYLALSRWRRLLHRVPRHPLVANVLLPPLVFLVLYRVPFDTPRGWVRERRSVYFTNAALVALFATLALLLGWREVLMVHLPLMVVASILGVWLFSAAAPLRDGALEAARRLECGRRVAGGLVVVRPCRASCTG
jgi:omega-6 fatty acid desaturase (delta-12 desaturase)